MDLLLLVIAGMTLLVSCVAAAAAVLSLRQPKLEVEAMGLAPLGFAPYGGRFRVEQERYKGEVPDSLLNITVRNRGKVPALRVSGSLHIGNPNFIAPLDYPGYENQRIQIAGSAGVYVVHLLPTDENRAPPEPTNDPLSFWIPVKHEGGSPWNTSDNPRGLEEGDKHDAVGRAKSTGVAYRFIPEQGAPIEGQWVVSDSLIECRPVPHEGPTVLGTQRPWWRRMLGR